MSKSSRKLRQVKKLKARQKKKAEKLARYAMRQDGRQRIKSAKKGRWRGIRREVKRNRARRGNVVSLVVFKKLMQG